MRHMTFAFFFIDAKRFVEQGVLNIDGNEVHFKLFGDNDFGTSNDATLSNSQRTVVINGDVSKASKDALEMYLENTKRSGGGELEEIDLDADPPTVTFVHGEGAYPLLCNPPCDL